MKALALKTLVFISMAGLIAACDRPMDKTRPEEGHTPAAPFTYAVTNADVSASLSLPEAVVVFPDLHKQLFDQGRADLDRFAERAGKDHAELKGFPLPPYAKSIGWGMGGLSPKLASLYARIATDEGGAHPNAEFQTVLWDIKSKREIDPRDLFAPNADLKPVNALLCRAVEAERSKRLGRPVRQGANCPRIEDAQIVLLPSTETGKLGGLAALFAPYEVGPYAEGGYEVRLPQGLIRSSLNPAFSAEFAGEPLPAPLLSDPPAEAEDETDPEAS